MGTFQILTHRETVNLIPRGFMCSHHQFPHTELQQCYSKTAEIAGIFLYLSIASRMPVTSLVCDRIFQHIDHYQCNKAMKSEHGSAISDSATYYSLNCLEVLLTCEWYFLQCYMLQTTAFINLHEWNPAELWLNLLNWGIITLDWLWFRRVTCTTFKGPFCFFSWMEFQDAI